jgi:hypothetical protein
MARKGDPLFIPNTGKGAVKLLTAEQIPEEVGKEVEEIYAYLQGNPDGRMRVEFDTKGELDVYALQVKSYCKLREPELYFRKSPARNLKPTQMDFRVTDVKPEEGEVASVQGETPAQPTGQEWRTPTATSGKRK